MIDGIESFPKIEKNCKIYIAAINVSYQKSVLLISDVIVEYNFPKVDWLHVILSFVLRNSSS